MNNAQEQVLQFWFEDTKPAQWFQVNPEFDRVIEEKFAETYDLGRDGLLDDWQSDADGCLALCIVLDQFPRNIFRGKPQAFETDKQALLIAKHAVVKGFDQILPVPKRRFLYMPYEHSEQIGDQRKSVALFEKMKEEDPMSYEYAVRHFDVIDRFGRFPHRNAILGRENTSEEEEYLAEPGAGF